MNFIKGVDVSMIKDLESHGASYRLNGKEEDLFKLLKHCGINMVRIRIWAYPYDESGNSYGGGGNYLQTTIEIAKRAVKNGMEFLLDFHYSDFWADPGKQVKPKAWENLTGIALETAVYLHTVNTLKALRNEQLIPKMVQVDQIDTMVLLIKSGLRGVREECPNAKIVLHLDFGTDNKMYRKWFDNIGKYSVDFDVIGLSYYPHWNGGLRLLTENMNDISERYDKDVLIAETSIGYTTETFGCKGAVYNKEHEKLTGYPATQKGQEDFLRELFKTVRNVKDGRGIGVFYWEPAWIPINDCTWASNSGCKYMNEKVEPGNAMANMALFDDKGNANSALLNIQTM